MYSAIASNKRKTIIIMIGFIIFVSLVVFILVQAFGGNIDVFYFGLTASIIYALITYYSGSRMALAVNGAQEIKQSDNPRLWRIVENMAITDCLPTPRVNIMNDPAPNAFATGRDPKTASVCVTTGLLEIMDD